ncbi:glycosyltransferase [Oceanobacillus caeni]|uniref:glycosyltransferase n=1 Tax=Oceanobacillus caeni TaxID=405946 RepID=UPI002E22637F|nr:glycosyltransferase [Oceanobacillus caeni]
MAFYLFSCCISFYNEAKENLVKRYKIKPEHVKVIYNPIDLENIRQSIENGSVKKEHFSLFKDDRKTIITAGRLVKQKDQKTLIKAFEKVNQTVNADLVILGEGELDNELKKLAKDLSIHDRVHFIGFQHNPYIFFEKADLFVLTSIHEGFGHVIAEALATGTPVISTNCQSGPKEVLDDGKYGLLTEVGNVEELAGKMLKILSMNEEELLQIQEKGYERAADFDARNIVKQYEDTFMEVIEGINRRG